MEGSGGIEPPVSPCAWGCACQSTCCPCCRRGYRAPAAGIGIGIRRGRRRCASGSCTRRAGNTDVIPACHLSSAIWSTIYGWWSTVAWASPGQNMRGQREAAKGGQPWVRKEIRHLHIAALGGSYICLQGAPTADQSPLSAARRPGGRPRRLQQQGRGTARS